MEMAHHVHPLPSCHFPQRQVAIFHKLGLMDMGMFPLVAMQWYLVTSYDKGMWDEIEK